MLEIIKVIFHPAVIWVLIPITAIAGSFYKEIKKAEFQSMTKAGFPPEDLKLMRDVLENNQRLTGRVENLEAIITSMDQELLTLKGGEDKTMNEENTKELAEKMRSKDI